MERHNVLTIRSTGYCLSMAIMLVLASSSAEATFLTDNLEVCDQGSFFVGGVPKITKFANAVNPAGLNAQITVGQMYVQFQVPVAAKKWPLIIVHGSTHSGACVESTPQGTEGWAPYAVRNGLATYVVDQPGRGRSGNDNSRLQEAEATHQGVPGANATFPNTVTPTGPAIGRISDNGAYTAWFGHLVQPGTATTCTDILTCELMPHGWRADDPSPASVHPDPAGYLPAFDLNATSDFIYPSNLVYTGTGTWGPTPFGPPKAYQLHYYRQLLPNYEVTLPTSTCPSCSPTALIQANTWSPRDVASLVERLGGAIVATHSQSGIQGHDMVRVLREDGKLNLLKGLITVEGTCSFANSGTTAADFDNVPYLAFKGDYTVFSQGCQDVVNAINARRAAGQGTARADYIQLDDPSYKGQFNGVTHMMMDGTNNLQVMDQILNWANKYIDNPPAKGNQKKVCNSPPPPAAS
jgi:hypothetical protein